MSWVHRTEAPAHTCAPPAYDCYIPSPVGTLGDLWRCDDCGKLWRIGLACDVCEAYGYHDRGQCMVGNAWRPARLMQRIRHRRRRHA